MVHARGQVGQAAPAVGCRRVGVNARRRRPVRRQPADEHDLARGGSLRRPRCAASGIGAALAHASTAQDERGDQPTRHLAHGSPSHVSTGTVPNSSPSPRKRASAGRRRAHAAVLDLQGDADPSGGRGADQPLRAALRDPARLKAHQVGVGRAALVADQAGVGGHRGRRSGRRRRASRAARTSTPSARAEREGEDAAAVDRGREPRRGLSSAASATSSMEQLLHRVSAKPVALDRPPARAADGEEAGVLAGAVVARAGSGRGPPGGRSSRSSSVAGACASSSRTAASCSGSARCDAQAIASSIVRDVGALARERQRLDRLRRTSGRR